MSKLDRLTGQLNHLPAIIGRLGLSIANSQKQLNADYVDNVVTLIHAINEVLKLSDPENSDTKSKLDALKTMLEALAPSRYQFTETTLEFRADLSESFDLAGSAAVGFGSGALTVNAGLTLGFGYDYRAAARITTVLHAYPTSPQMAKDLLSRAEKLTANNLPLPEVSQREKEMWSQIDKMVKALDLGESAIATDLPTPAADAGTGSGGGDN